MIIFYYKMNIDEKEKIIRDFISGRIKFKDLPFQTEEICKYAVESNPKNLEFVNEEFRTDDIIKIAIIKNPAMIFCFENPSEEIALLALEVSKNYKFVKIIRNQTPKVHIKLFDLYRKEKEEIEKNSFYYGSCGKQIMDIYVFYQFIINPTDKINKLFIKHDFNMIHNVRNLSEKLCIELIVEYGRQKFNEIPSLTINVEIEKIVHAPELLHSSTFNFEESHFISMIKRNKYVTESIIKDKDKFKVSNKVLKLCVQIYPFSIQYFDEQPEELVLLSLELDDNIFNFIKNKTKDMCKITVDKNPSNIKLIPRNFLDKEMCNQVFNSNMLLLKYIPANFQDENMCLKFIREFSSNSNFTFIKIFTDIILKEMIIKYHTNYTFNVGEYFDMIKDDKIKNEIIELLPDLINRITLNQALCYIAINKNSNLLVYIPIQYRSEDLLKKCLQLDYTSFQHFTELEQTYKMCLFACNCNSRSKNYIKNRLMYLYMYLV